MPIAAPSKSEGPVALLESQFSEEQKTAENKILELLKALGGPTSVRDWFVESERDIDPNDVMYHLV